MRRLTSLLICALSAIFIITSCQKENSYEGGPDNSSEVVPGTSSGTALFVMAGEPDNCISPVVSGIYKAAVPMDASNTVEILVNVTTAGTWNVSTGLTNGVKFTGSGTFASVGLQSIILTGTGIPIQTGTFTFRAGSAGCKFPITFTAGTITANCKACNYIPYCDGSTYSYIDTTSGGVTPVTQNLTYLTDSIMYGGIYKKFAVTGSAGNTYYNCTGGVSTSVVLNGISIGGTTIPVVKMVMLKANSPVGTTWQDTISLGAGSNAIFTSVISAKGISRAVLGTTFNDVIHVQQLGSIVIPGLGNTPFSTGDYYYAKDVGLIESLTLNTTSTPATLALHRVLQSYNIP